MIAIEIKIKYLFVSSFLRVVSLMKGFCPRGLCLEKGLCPEGVMYGGGFV